MGKKAPKAPDYAGAAREQAEGSRDVTEQQTWANRPDQFTPFGSSTWESTPTRDPTTGQLLNRWSNTTQLNPQSQAALDAQLATTRARSELASSLTGRMQNEYGQPMDWAGLSPMGQTPEAMGDAPDVGEYRNRAEEALYGRMSSRLDPRFQQQEQDIRTRLYNQGLREGDEAWDRELGNFGRERTDAYQTAMNEAIMGGGSEGQRELGMFLSGQGQQYDQQLGSANYANQLRQQQIAESLQQRGFSLNEINAMLYGQQVGMPSMPNFSTASRAEAPQMLQAAQMTGQHELDAFNAQQAGLQGLMSGGAGLFAFSDRRLKSNIRRIGSINGIPLYSYEIFGVPTIGVMSDEVDSSLVIRHPSGYDMVNYGAIYG